MHNFLKIEHWYSICSKLICHALCGLAQKLRGRFEAVMTYNLFEGLELLLHNLRWPFSLKFILANLYLNFRTVHGSPRMVTKQAWQIILYLSTENRCGYGQEGAGIDGMFPANSSSR